MILPKIRDKRFITIRRGGSLTDNDHHLLALWAAECAEHVLHLFETTCPNDDRPRNAIKATRIWVNGEISMTMSKSAAYAIRAVMEATSKDKREELRIRECLWQRERLHENIRELVLGDQGLRNEICWYVFDMQNG